MEAHQLAPAPAARVDAFIARWTASGPAERANFPSFAIDLCDLLGLDQPEPAGADAAHDRYRFEHPVTFRHPDNTASTGRIDAACPRPSRGLRQGPAG